MAAYDRGIFRFGTIAEYRKAPHIFFEILEQWNKIKAEVIKTKNKNQHG